MKEERLESAIWYIEERITKFEKIEKLPEKLQKKLSYYKELLLIVNSVPDEKRNAEFAYYVDSLGVYADNSSQWEQFKHFKNKYAEVR